MCLFAGIFAWVILQVWIRD